MNTHLVWNVLPLAEPPEPKDRQPRTVYGREDYRSYAIALAQDFNDRTKDKSDQQFSAEASCVVAEQRSQITVWGPAEDAAEVELVRSKSSIDATLK